MRDVFYFGDKPNVHPREQFVNSLTEAISLSRSEHFWIINEYCDYTDFDWDFDFDLLPDEDVWAQDYINVFPSQWCKDSGTWLCPTTGCTDKIYRSDVTPVQRKNEVNRHWETLYNVNFDYSWHPDSDEPPFIYVFGNQWHRAEDMHTVYYKVEGATDYKFMDIKATLKENMSNWVSPTNVEDFDYSWVPNPHDLPYIYQFGTQWAKTHGPVYYVEGATEVKYVSDVVATVKKDMTFWSIPANVNVDEFDFSWHPDATSPPYIYQFGTILDELDGPRYLTPGNDGTVVHLERFEIILEELEFPKYYIKTTLEDLISEHDNEIFWALNPDIDYSNFDFKWVPDKRNVYHVNCFGSQYNMNTQTYFVNGKMWNKGFRDINYIEDKVVESKTKIAMFFVDKGNSEAQERFEYISSKYDNVIKTRYLNNWVDTIGRCVNRSETNLFWVLSSELDYSDFEFDYYPSPWQMKMVHVFGTQWSHWGNTYIVNKESFLEQTKYVKVIEHLPVLNFVKDKRAKATDCLYDVIVIDHGNDYSIDLSRVKTNVTFIRYNKSYLQTFKDYFETLVAKKEHYVWVCSSICDYSNFDFTYIPDPYSKQQLHVFPSNQQKFGDTFLIDINKLKETMNSLERLEDFDKVNYNNHQRVNRLPAPVITVLDSQAELVNCSFNFPYAVFNSSDNTEIEVDNEPLNVWDESKTTVLVTKKGASRILVPKHAKDFINNEVYDYPYIDKNISLKQSKPLDIIFLSNGEKLADEHYEKLLQITKHNKNRIVRVDGINGRANAYKTAAAASETPWFFTVFAKLDMNVNFDFNWQPDRLQARKHYIFTATNPVNNLEYGHQALIVYNKKLVLDNPGIGLDFTLDDLHEVVDINSGVARFDTDEYSTWRTSFRECVKLKNTVVNNPDDLESIKRLTTWATVGNGSYGEYSVNGSLDAIEYYDSVNGDMDKLKLTYEWAWLKDYYNTKYNL